MRHKKLSPRDAVQHRVVSAPRDFIPTATYKARIQGIVPVGPKIVVQWAIFKGKQ